MESVAELRRALEAARAETAALRAQLRERTGSLEEMIQAMLVGRTVPIEQPTTMDSLGRELMGMLDPTQDKVRTQHMFSRAVEIERSLNSPGMKMKPRCGVCVLGPTWMAWAGVHVGPRGHSCPCKGGPT